MHYCARGSKGNSQLPLEPLANSDIPLVVIIDLLLLKNITKTASNSSKLPPSNDHYQ